MKKRSFIALLILVAFLCAGCGNTTLPKATETPDSVISGEKDTTTEANADSVSPDKWSENIKCEIVPIENEDELCVFLCNENAVTVDDLEFEIYFKNEAGEIIDKGWDGHDAILPGSTVVSTINTPTDYASYETKVTTDEYANPYTNHAKNVKLTSNQGDDCIILTIENMGDVLIEEIEYAVVFYKGDKIVKVTTEDIYDLEAHDTTVEKEDLYPLDGEEDYDRWEVYINQAHTF